MNKLLGTLLFSIILLSACDSKQMSEKIKETIAHLTNKSKEVKINQYSMLLPGYMELNTSLKPGASLQYANLNKELYVIVIDESKGSIDSLFSHSAAIYPYKDSTLFGTYMNLMLAMYLRNMTDTAGKKMTDVNIHSMAGKQLTMTGTYNNLPIFNYITLLEGKSHFYQIYSWTLAKYKEKNGPDIEKMISSFKEI